MFKYLPCTSWNTTELYDIFLSSIECFICYMGNLYFIISIISIILLYIDFIQIAFIQEFISIISITISIIFSIGFSYISALYRYHELIKRLVVHELDVRSKFQGSGDALYMHLVDGDRDALFARMEAHVKDKYEDLFTRLQGFSFFITEEQLKTLPLKFRTGSAERLLEIMCQLRSPVYPIFP